MNGIEKIYDIIHQDKNYKKESEILVNLIKKEIKKDQIELLDVGCGTGNHLFFFQNYFKCNGVEINEKLVKISNSKKLEVELGDMKKFNLNKKFDVITCLFGSIGYLNNCDELHQTLINFKNHINLNGIIIIEPWLFLEQYAPGTRQRIISKDISVVSKNTLIGNISRLEKQYSVFDKKYNCTIDLCCFTKNEFLFAIKEAKFNFVQIERQLEIDYPNGIFLLRNDS